MLSRWARKLHIPGLESGSSSSDPENRLPVLPNPQPRPITPPSSVSEDLPSKSAITRNVGAFARLPFELRQRILVEAFGEQTIHIDLVYGRPREEDKPQGGASNKYHHLRRAPRPSKEEQRSSALYKFKPKRWRWYSSVCHSVAPFEIQPWSRMDEPSNDACAATSDILHHCSWWPGEAPHKCQIGIIGWLLTCRQA